MSNEELRDLVARAVNAAAPTPVFLNPLVVDEELRVASANFGGSHGYNVSSGPNPGPYTVRWDANLERFVIYLQRGDHLFYFNGAEVTVEIRETSAAPSDGWYILPELVHDDGEVWLQVYTSTTVTGKDHVRVALEGSTATPHGNEQVVASILVARLYHNCHGPVVEQKVTSAVCLGGTPGNTFDKGWYSTYKSVDGWHFSNRYYRIGDKGFIGEDGTVDRAGCWCLTVTKGRLYENKIEFFKDVPESFAELPDKYIIPLFVFEEDDDYDPDTAPSKIHPVLDCRLGPYVGGIGSEEDHGCFAIVGEGLESRYFWNGSHLYEMPALTLTDEMADKILAISLQGGNAPTYEFYSTIDSLNNSAASQDAVIIPLYKFGAHREVEVDFREMPRGDSWAVKA